MSDTSTARLAIRDVLQEIAPDASGKVLRAAERKLIKALASVLVGDGYTINMAGDALGVPASTLRTWRDRDPEFARRLGSAKDGNRKWLLGELRARLEVDGLDERKVSGVGQAINVMANLAFPELRRSEIKATGPGVPSPGESRSAVLDILNKGASVELPEPLALPDTI